MARSSFIVSVLLVCFLALSMRGASVEACAPLSDPCSKNSDCCSAVCKKICTSGNCDKRCVCKAIGQGCSKNANCCKGKCKQVCILGKCDKRCKK